MKQKLLLLMLLCMAVFANAQAQTHHVTGRVSGANDGKPISGVTVSVVGTSVATQTDQEGRYAILGMSEGRLSFSFVGYESQAINIGRRSIINVELQATNENIERVVVVGYGRQDKALTTQSVGTVDAKSFRNMPIQTPQQALQGQVAGVNMVNSSGVLGAEAQITIRGGSSLSAGGRPLYVIDGVPLNSNGASYTGGQGGASALNPLININPNDIESMSVLKDAAAVSIYGSRGANGVILITTKKGNQQGGTKVTADLSTGWSKPTALEPMMDAEQWLQFRRDYLIANNMAVPNFPVTSYNWIDNVVRTGGVNTANVAVSGGDDKTTFYIGGTYGKESGYTIGNEMQRLSAKINLEHKISEYVRLGINYNTSNVDMDRIGLENNTEAPLTAAYLQLPYITPYGADGQFQNTGFVSNVVAIAETGINNTIFNRSTGNAFLDVKILDGLTFRSDWGIDRLGADTKFRAVDVIRPGGLGSRAVNTDNKWLSTNTINFNRVFNASHKIGALLGHSFETAKLTQLYLEGTGFASDDLPNVGSASNPTATREEVYEWALESQFARLNYAFEDRYVFEGSFRRDGSSRFGQNRRYGNFYALSGGWIISNEAFFNKNNTYIQFLKLTGSYGTAGNDNIGYNAFMGTFVAGRDVNNQVVNYNGESGLVPNRIANPNLSWEEMAQTDIGITARLLNRLDIQMNYYNKISRNLLLNVALPYTTGFATAAQNVGRLRNRGFEFAINSTNIEREDFTWMTSLNIAFNKNTVLELPENRDAQGRNFLSGSGQQRAVEGESKNSFYLIRYNGVNPNTGDAEWLDINGNATITPTANDRVIVGKGDPNFQGGFTNTFRYRNFDLTAFFNFSYGNDVYVTSLEFTDNVGSGAFNKSTALLDYWRQPGDIAYAPALNSITRTTVQQVSTRHLFDGSYIRLKTLSMGYNLPSQTLSSLKIFSGARVYFLAQNLWTIKNSDFRGDPEISANGASNLVVGETFFALPQAKTYTFGINLTL